MNTPLKTQADQIKIKEAIIKSIINKSTDFKRKQKKAMPPENAQIKEKTNNFPDIMTTREAAEYIRSSSTTLQKYEKVGFIKAVRHRLPGKTRGKVTWLKSDLDKLKYGAYLNSQTTLNLSSN